MTSSESRHTVSGARCRRARPNPTTGTKMPRLRCRHCQKPCRRGHHRRGHPRHARRQDACCCCCCCCCLGRPLAPSSCRTFGGRLGEQKHRSPRPRPHCSVAYPFFAVRVDLVWLLNGRSRHPVAIRCVRLAEAHDKVLDLTVATRPLIENLESTRRRPAGRCWSGRRRRRGRRSRRRSWRRSRRLWRLLLF